MKPLIISIFSKKENFIQSTLWDTQKEYVLYHPKHSLKIQKKNNQYLAVPESGKPLELLINKKIHLDDFFIMLSPPLQLDPKKYLHQKPIQEIGSTPVEHENHTARYQLTSLAIFGCLGIMISLLYKKPKYQEIIPKKFQTTVLTTPAFTKKTKQKKVIHFSKPVPQESTQLNQVFESEPVKSTTSIKKNNKKTASNKKQKNSFDLGGLAMSLEKSIFNQKLHPSKKNTNLQIKDGIEHMNQSEIDMLDKETQSNLFKRSGGSTHFTEKHANYSQSSGKATGLAKSGFIQLDTDNAIVNEGLTPEQVGKVIHAHLNEIRYCQESILLKGVLIDGKVTIAFTIGANGLVQQANVKESTLEEINACLLSHLKRWKFPRPTGNTAVKVTYPFVFKTLQ